MRMKFSTTFAVSVFIGAIAIFGMMWRDSNSLTKPPVAPLSKLLSKNIFVSEQISTSDITRLKQDGFTTLIDMRPDGEVEGQPTAAQMGGLAQKEGLQFSYIPTPHGDIPEEVVTSLARSLDNTNGKVLLYCRSGKRASRSWALMEASRKDGLGADQIESALKAVDQPIDDLKDNILKRIASRAANQ